MKFHLRSPRIIAKLEEAGFVDTWPYDRLPRKHCEAQVLSPEGMSRRYAKRLVSCMMMAHKIMDRAPTPQLRQVGADMIESLLDDAKERGFQREVSSK